MSTLVLKLKECSQGRRNVVELHKGKIQAHFFPLSPYNKKNNIFLTSLFLGTQNTLSFFSFHCVC